MSETGRKVGIFHSLGFRLGLFVGVALAVGLTVHFVVSMAHHEEALLSLKKEEASVLAGAIQVSLNDAMMEGESGRKDLQESIEKIGKRPMIDRVRILNSEGVVQYSTDAAEIGRRVEQSAPDCRQCHAGEVKPVSGEIDLASCAYEPSAPGESGRVLGVIHPIYNDMDPASCMVCHDDRKLLGKLDVVVSLGNLDADIRHHRGALVLFGLLGVGGIIAIVTAAIHLLVHRPVARLLDGTRKIGSLDLSHRLPADRRDELGNLAQAFNDMTGRLQQAQEKIRNFTASLEEKVEEKTKELQAAQLSMLRAEKMAAIGRMAAGVAHEINNPLTGVITFATLLKRRTEDPGSSEDLDTIIEEAHRCSNIARGLLDFSRGGVLSTREVRMNRLLDRTLGLVEKQAAFHNIEIVREYDPDLPAVTLDEDRIGQVILNLVMNAAEAMGDGGRLTIRTLSIGDDGRDDGDSIGIHVEDTGPGIPDSVAARVFEPFFTTKEPGRGTGLGLSVSYGIVADHGGRIRVEGRPGEGARFVVTLPVDGGNE
ncbi:MAG: ATP-binding protein [Planctomycetota bacterium]